MIRLSILIFFALVVAAQAQAVVPGVGTPPSSFATGQVAIATAGTAVQITAGTLQTGVVIKASITNVATIILGSSSSVSTTATGTGNGFPLAPGDAVTIALSNGSAAWINGTNAGDFVSYVKN